MKDLMKLYKDALAKRSIINEISYPSDDANDTQPGKEFFKPLPPDSIWVDITSPFDKEKSERLAKFIESRGLECEYIDGTTSNMTGADLPFAKGGSFYITARTIDKAKLNLMLMIMFNTLVGGKTGDDAYRAMLSLVHKALCQYVVYPDDELEFEEAFAEEIEKYGYDPDDGVAHVDLTGDDEF
jgi:hypothetical protein